MLHYNDTSLYLYITTLQQHFVVTGHVTGAVAKKECSAAYQKRGCPLCLTFLEDAISRDIHLQGCKRFRASPLIQVSENRIENRDGEERGRTREGEGEGEGHVGETGREGWRERMLAAGRGRREEGERGRGGIEEDTGGRRGRN